MGSNYISPQQLGQLRFETAVPFGRKTSWFDQFYETPGAAWGDEAYDAPASEDINWSGQSEDFIGLGQTSVPTPDVTAAATSSGVAPAAAAPATAPKVRKPRSFFSVKKLVVAGAIASLGLLAWNYCSKK